MTEADNEHTLKLPPRSPEWMRAAAGKPFEELPQELQNWIEEIELGVHFELAQDIRHCESELIQLEGQRPRLAFKEFEAARSFLRKEIDEAERQGQQLADAEPTDRLLTLAWIIDNRKSADAGARALDKDARPASPPAEGPGAPMKKKAFDSEEATALLAGKKYGGGWKIAPTENQSGDFLLQNFTNVPVHPHRAIRKKLWPFIPRGPRRKNLR